MPRTPKRKAEIENNGLTSRRLLAKALVATDVSVDEPAAMQDIQAVEEQWGEQGAVIAPYDPEVLMRLSELTPHLQPNIDAYAQNIDGYGYKAQPKARWMEDLETEEAEGAIKSAIEYERWLEVEDAAMDETTKAEADVEVLRVRLEVLPVHRAGEERIPAVGPRRREDLRLRSREERLDLILGPAHCCSRCHNLGPDRCTFRSTKT